MDVHCHEIKNVSIGSVITIFMAQVNVEFGGSENFINSSFNIGQFQETLDTFHRLQGDILVLPEYYLPPDRLSEVIERVQHSNELNRIYLIPLSQLDLPKFERLQRKHEIISEEILADDVSVKKFALNVVLILVKDNFANLSIFSQFKTLPSIQETKPHLEIYRARHFYIFEIDQILNFAVPICFSFIGKEYNNTHNLEPLIPYIESGRVDCLFIPQHNPKPLHWTFIKSINHICNVSNGATSIFMTNVASGIGQSSIVDMFSKRILTSEYDFKELEYPGYEHLIFVSSLERLFRYRFVLPKYRKNRRSPEFVREVALDVFSYDKNNKKWNRQEPQIIYPYKSANEYTHIRFSPEVLELRSRLPWDIDYSLDYVRTISRESELGGIDDWEGLAEQVFFLTESALMRQIPLGPDDLVWILKLVGEYHEQIGCNLAAYYFYDMMNRIAYTIPSQPAILVSDYLLMRICSRFEDKQKQDFALKKAKEFLSFVTDRPEYLSSLGVLLPTVLFESSMIISWFNNTYFPNMYEYGSRDSAVKSIEYNTNETGKQRLVSRLLTEGKRQIESHGLSVTSTDYLRYLDISCLTSLILGRDKEAERFAQRMRELDYRHLNLGAYLASKHNETLLLQIRGEKKEAEKQYLELIQEQREYNGVSSPITVRNLSVLLEDKEVARYLLDVVDYGNSLRVHREISLVKARRLYRFRKHALRHML